MEDDNSLDMLILATFRQLSQEQKIKFLLSIPDLLKDYEAGKRGRP